MVCFVQHALAWSASVSLLYSAMQVCMYPVSNQDCIIGWMHGILHLRCTSVRKLRVGIRHSTRCYQSSYCQSNLAGLLTNKCMQASTKTKIRGPPMSSSSRFKLRVLLLAMQVDLCKMPVISIPNSASGTRQLIRHANMIVHGLCNCSKCICSIENFWELGNGHTAAA